MKKILLSMMMLTIVCSAFAQTPEEKAAAKAAAAAQKAAEKKAKDEVAKAKKLFDAGSALLVPDPYTKKARTHEDTLSAMDKFREGEVLLNTALSSGNVPEKQLYESWMTRKMIANHLMNYNLVKFNKEPFDTVECCQSILTVTDGMENIIKYHKKSDEVQAKQAKLEAANVMTMSTYMGYRSYFYVLMKDIENAAKALEDYMAYPNRFAAVCPEIKNATPDPSYENLGFNIYLLSFNAKKYDLAEKFYDIAARYNDEQSHKFVLDSRPQMYLQQGDTAKWIAALEEIIEKEPKSANAEVAVQNLLAYYSKKGNDAMSAFADKILARNPEDKMGNYGKGHSLFAASKFEEALEYFKKTIDADPEFVEGYNMCGMCLYRQAADNYFNKIDGKKFKTQAELNAAEEKLVKSIYRDAIVYFEACREKAPNETSLWAGQLKTIYVNLGEKAKAEEMEQYLK